MKTDGATLYITRDMATAMYRKRTYDFVKSIYVVGQEQINHFKQLKAVLKEMDFDWSDDMTHITFGLVTKDKKSSLLVKETSSCSSQHLTKLFHAPLLKSKLKP